MRRLMASIILLVAVSMMGTAARAPEQAGADRDALLFAEVCRERFCTVVRGLDADPEILMPVVFPEIARYSSIRDNVETAGLYILYANFGKAYADFSIGRFQMKPSFADTVEALCRTYHCAACSRLLAYTEEEGGARRRARLRRLGDTDWQIRYLACFYHVCMGLYGDSIVRMDREGRIRFLAATYNYGVGASFAAISEWQRNQTGHVTQYGGFHGTYCDVALEFYRRYWQLHFP